MSAYLDTNVLIRHITRDDPTLAGRATRLFDRGTALILTPVVFLETAFVLRTVYGYPRELVARTLKEVLALPAIATDSELLATALQLHVQRGCGLTDAVIAAHALVDGPPVVASFDRDLDRVPGLERLAP
ncbi:MAG: PIN domain-containing protein [Actinomycetota bacterium]